MGLLFFGDIVSDNIALANIELRMVFTIIIVGISIATFSMTQYHRFYDVGMEQKLKNSYYVNFFRQASIYGGIGFLISFFVLISSIDIGDAEQSKSDIEIFLYNLSYIISMTTAHIIVIFLLWYFVIIRFMHKLASGIKGRLVNLYHYFLKLILSVQVGDIDVRPVVKDD
ncbi:hypothetical protein OO006_00545 [Prosthecochloris sp. SCSIO W1101]|uniref:hypothetical protein n=1 Tax=Prosthecochloris sp. SCSIO W1101 TaxID=2992242 RepID=UPI00223CDA3C|nr:hypothetical protein [Prosthecochloris sp. SCSIO W1101]UZJ41538.1 hypothetical protein OO006_00545 [Prosthecochloris sp. SCSIO W1101]